LDARNWKGETALHLAAWNNDTSTIQMLLNKGASLSPLDENGQAPLHHAASNGSTHAILAFITAEADISVKDEYGRTAIALAISMGHRDAVMSLWHSRQSDWHTVRRRIERYSVREISNIFD